MKYHRKMVCVTSSLFIVPGALWKKRMLRTSPSIYLWKRNGRLWRVKNEYVKQMRWEGMLLLTRGGDLHCTCIIKDVTNWRPLGHTKFQRWSSTSQKRRNAWYFAWSDRILEKKKNDNQNVNSLHTLPCTKNESDLHCLLRTTFPDWASMSDSLFSK